MALITDELSAAKDKLNEWRFTFYTGSVVFIIIFIVGMYNDYLYAIAVAAVAVIFYPFVSMAKTKAYENYHDLKIAAKAEAQHG